MKQMKKILSLLLCLSVLTAGLLMTSCGQGSAQASGSGVSLTYEKRYIYEESIGEDGEKQNYYVFHRDGTADYHYYYIYESSYEPSTDIESYTVRLRYLVEKDLNQVICFFDSVEYAPEHNQARSIDSTWVRNFTASEHVLLAAGQSRDHVYVCEDCLPDIPNFGKALSTGE